MKPAQPSPIIKMAVLGIVSLGFFYLADVLGQAAEWIQRLPVEGATFSSRADSPAPAAAPVTGAAIHPLLQESSKKAADLRSAAPRSGSETVMVSLDTLFGRSAAQRALAANAAPARAPAPPGASAPLPPLYDDISLLKQVIQLQATTSNGAIVNGSFYGVGEPLTGVPYQSSKTNAVRYPVLTAVRRDQVTLTEGGKPGRSFVVPLPR